VALAEMLYRQGRQLMADGKVSEACPKFAESYRLDAATGTLLNLAACHEAEHKLATAWLEYSEAVALARRDKREDRIRFAQDRLAAMEPKLSHLTVVVNAEAEAPELEIQVDKVSVRRAAWGVPAPVDPGSHTVEARANGRKAWTKEITVGQEPVNVTVTVPSLELASTAPAPTPVEPAPIAPTADKPTRPIPSSVYVAGAITLGLTLGAVSTGVVYVSRRSQYLDSRSDGDRDAARRWGLVNLPLVGGALVGGAVTAILYATRPAAPSPRVGVATTVAPWFGAGSAGVVVEGSL
jgi:hypothetical protein